MAHIRTGLLNGISNGIENRPVKMGASSFAGSNATYNLGAVFNHLCCMKCAFSTGKTLYNDLG